VPSSPPLLSLAASALLGAALGACAPSEPPAPTGPTAAPAGVGEVPPIIDARSARAEIQPVGDGRARGTVTLTEVSGGVRVQAQLEGLSASGFHAFQILRWADCGDQPDAAHLGAETGAPHGGPYAPPGFRHAGDLGNVRGDEGDGRYDRVDPVLTLDGSGSAAGRAVVIRALPDDAVSPDGAAGAVLGCGVLEAVR